jgi:ABC-type dipeptide/oligopeptide/nickel transport system ATPase component
MQPVLQVRDLAVGFATSQGFAEVIHGVSFDLERERTLCLVGESGSGKSVTCHAILGLLAGNGRRLRGEILFEGQDLARLRPAELNRIRGGRIGMVFQDPLGSLNPVRTVGAQLDETLRLHMALSAAGRRERAIELMKLVGIPEPERRLKAYPHQLSGGMAQRVMIALALACEPVLLIADEPTTALDVTIQAQVVDLLRRLQREMAMTILFVTHDLGVVAEMADEVVVMRHGAIVERGEVQAIFDNPAADYTRELIGAIPDLDEPAPAYRAEAGS